MAMGRRWQGVQGRSKGDEGVGGVLNGDRDALKDGEKTLKTTERRYGAMERL